MTHDDSLPLRFFINSYSNNANLSAQKGVLSMWQHNMAFNINQNIQNDVNLMRTDMEKCIESFLDGDVIGESKALDELLLEYFNAEKLRRNTYRNARNGKPIFLVIKFEEKQKKKFRELLRKDGYDEAFVFPGYQSVAKLVNERLGFI